ncbi:MAG: sucrose phosphorylase [Anaerolineaceae bacterium]|nr:sucrose phosphorylase [Anaerolineaceae bacterium]
MAIKNQVQLITYPDSLGGDLKSLDAVVEQDLAGICQGGIHILPPFPSSGDRGFAPLRYDRIEPRFGDWQDLRRLGERYDLLIDLMVNHISRQSPYFQDFLRKGRRSEYADLFITLDKVWPEGKPPAGDVARIFLRKPDQPFSTVAIDRGQTTETVWTTFGSRDWSEQIDLDVRSPQTRQLLSDYLALFRSHNIKIVRLDAVGYVIKKPGTTCFMVEPEIFEFIDWAIETAHGLGMEVLPEVHDHYSVQARLAEHGYWVYDFVLPMLVLYTLAEKDSRKLRAYLAHCPRQQFTMLDCHDGIPVQPDVDGILDPAESRRVIELCLARGANLNPILSTSHLDRDGFDAHQVNCTYYSALGCDDDAYLAARAIQFFAPGVPQVYYVGLLAGQNDQAGVLATGEGRAINRHNYSRQEIAHAIQTPVVQRLLRLIRFRNQYPAFGGEFTLAESGARQLALGWKKGPAECRLRLDLDDNRAVIDYLSREGGWEHYTV